MFGDYTFGESYFGEGPGADQAAQPPMEIFSGTISLRTTLSATIAVRPLFIEVIRINDIK